MLSIYDFEQMLLETHFQYENPILGRFGQSGLQRKKIQAAISLRAVFLCFHGQKIINFFLKNVVVSAQKSYILHSWCEPTS
jgi:hypothetical protein